MKVVFCCNDKWLDYLKVALYALLKFNIVNKIYLFTEKDSLDFLSFFTRKYQVDIQVINYKKIIDKYFTKNNKNRNTYYSDAALVRIFIEDYLNEDKVLYLDVDALVLSDISSLWQIDINNYYLAAVEDIKIQDYIDYMDIINLPEKCFNSGVLLMNLKLMRKDNIKAKTLSLLAKNEYRFPDQDVLNIVCQNKVLFLDNKYNSSYSCGLNKNQVIRHYSTPKKNWLDGHFQKELWYDLEKEFKEKYQLFIENK